MLTSFCKRQKRGLLLQPLSCWTHWCSCWRLLRLWKNYHDNHNPLGRQSQSNWVARMQSIYDLTIHFMVSRLLASAASLVRRRRRQGCKVHGLYLFTTVFQPRRLYLEWKSSSMHCIAIERRQLFPFVLSKRVSTRAASSYADGKLIFEIGQTAGCWGRASLWSLDCETSLWAIYFEDPVVGNIIDLE